MNVFSNFLRRLSIFPCLILLRISFASGGQLEDAQVVFEANHYNRAYKQLIPFAQHGNAEAQYLIGAMYYNGSPEFMRDRTKALPWFLKSAGQGYVRAEQVLATMYFSGDGTKKDYAESAKWCRKAAEQGSWEAQTMLASLYLIGAGVPQDYAEAMKWLRKPAESGRAGAQFQLGVMHEKGLGAAPDAAEAQKWYRKSLAGGYRPAQVQLQALLDRLERERLGRLHRQFGLLGGLAVLSFLAAGLLRWALKKKSAGT